MRVLKTEDCFSISGGDGPEGGAGCTSADTDESCKAREKGYDACNALGTGLTNTASIFGNNTMQTLAGEAGPACYKAVDNYVNWQYKTPMYEKRNMSAFERSVIASGGTISYD